ncbi:MAG TPA: hypothetical protein PK559_04285 [Ignavibacteriaceae bacterium]|nr:hypothetical protein [Ignavibacteriaceae bacterium]
MYRKKIVFITALFFSTLFLVGCSDDPSSLGVGLLGPDLANVIELNSETDSLLQNSTYYKRVLNLSTAQKFLVGQANGVLAKSFVRFNISLTSDEKSWLAVDSLEIVSAIISFYPNYQYGDTNSSFDMSGYQIRSDWTPQSIKADSLSFLDIDSSISQINLISYSDTLITYRLRNDMALQWFKAEAGLDTSINREFGLYLKSNSGTNKILGFQAFSTTAANQPKITYIYGKKGNSEVDTVDFKVLSDVHIIEGDFPQISNENIMVQSSATYESKVFFDLSKLPKDAIINSAILTLTRDSVESLTGNGYTDAISVYALSDTSANLPVFDYLYTGSLSRSGNTYTGSVVWLVNKMFKENNLGFGFTIYNQVEGVERLVLAGSNNSNFSIRPKLIIKYSVNK